MKVVVEDKGIGINSVHIWKLNKNTIRIIIDTKLKYPEVFHGGSYTGNYCTELRTIITDESSENGAGISFIPETGWEKEFVNNCDYFIGSTRYGPEIIYIRTELENPCIGYWENKTE